MDALHKLEDLLFQACDALESEEYANWPNEVLTWWKNQSQLKKDLYEVNKQIAQAEQRVACLRQKRGSIIADAEVDEPEVTDI